MGDDELERSVDAAMADRSFVDAREARACRENESERRAEVRSRDDSARRRRQRARRAIHHGQISPAHTQHQLHLVPIPIPM